MTDPLMAVVCSAGLVLLIAFAELLRRMLRIRGRITRLSVHVACGALAAMVPWLFSGPLWPAGVALAAAVVVAAARWRGLLPSIHAVRPHSYGTVWFPLSALILYLAAWHTPLLVTAPLLVMAFADAAGVLVGEGLRFPRRLPDPLGGKTWDGSVAVFAITGLAVTVCWEVFGYGTTGSALLVGLACAPVAAAVEALSRRGLDNLTLPLAVAFSLLIILRSPQGPPWPALTAEMLALVVAVVAYRWGALRADGAFAAFVLATWLLTGGGWSWTLPVLVFFVLSSALSRLRNAARASALGRAEKGARRDLGQVAANGGVPLGLFVAWVLGSPATLMWPAFLGAVATATSDTWATEIGTSFRSEARLITSGRTVPAGTSGGVTIPGLIGGMAGAAVIGLTALVVPAEIGSGRWLMPVAGSVGGLVGCLLDSVLGATVQAHWRDAEGQVTEKGPPRADRARLRVRGVGWVNNDAVNALSALGGATLAVVLAILTG